MATARLEILSLVPTSYNQCSSCEMIYGQAGIRNQIHQEIMAEYPAELMDDHLRLSNWVTELSQRYGDRLQIRLVDPQSALGLWLSLRYRVRRYPTFIVSGQKIVGWDRGALEAALQRTLSD